MSTGRPQTLGTRPPGQAEDKHSTESEAALRDMSEAVASRKIETICTAYLSLRRSGRALPQHGDLDRGEGPNGRVTREVIVSAFSQRRCLMCEDGTAACHTCEGTGLANQFRCPSCEGLGFEVCQFCMGAGWSDEDEIPEEIRGEVHARRMRSAKKDLSRLAEMPHAAALESARHATPEQRRKISPWLLRVQARLTKLSGGQSSDANQFTTTCRAACERIDQLLEAIRPKPPRRPEE